MDTSAGSLTDIQKRVLAALEDVEPPFVLGGGGAVAGVYFGHRLTRDLDLFWRDRSHVGELLPIVQRKLEGAGFSVTTLQSAPAFVSLRVTDEASTVVVDLIAEPSASIEPPAKHRVGSAEILVETPHALLVEKLCALLGRAELRDLIDVEALVNRGENLSSAISDAPRRDSGFSPLTLAWVLRDFDVNAVARALGNDDGTAARLEAFRDGLIAELVKPA